ncbi:hypothetical protein VDGD_21205 [Verticillium dahliae]|uniref:Uncharacterized protein n=1 Tax=Verticillium dahliae TaxID=27337 RepID=A0A366NLV1_VERDA|nr:hypothetical protein VDGD_21205 [Verticillium dahliae]RXG44050.1 hypothetical protein VDGE_21205 [Verticillium dahliae]
MPMFYLKLWNGPLPSSSLDCALKFFDSVRRPHYALFRTMDQIASKRHQISTESTSVEEIVIGQVDNVSSPVHNWIYRSDADQTLADTIVHMKQGTYML